MKMLPVRSFLMLPLLLALSTAINAQTELVTGPNVNMVMTSPTASGNLTGQLGSPVQKCQGLQPCDDTNLQWENEPSCDASPRNPRAYLCGSNDTRLVGSDTGTPTELAAVWCAQYRTSDGGQNWQSTLIPGYPGDNSATGNASPIKGFQACGDSSVRFHPNGLGIHIVGAFNSGTNGLSRIAAFRFMHNNNKENGSWDNTNYIDAYTVDTGTAGVILDRASTAIGLPFQGAPMCTIPEQTQKGKVIPAQSFPCGTIYTAYGFFKGQDPNFPRTNETAEVRVARSTDGGKTWAINKPFQTYPLVNFTSVAVAPRTSGVGQDTVYVATRAFASGTKSKHAFLLGKSIDGGKTWGKPVVVAEFANADELFIQPASMNSSCKQCFRTNPAPAITVDDAGTVYYAFAMRLGPQTPGGGGLRDSRIVVAAFPNGNVGPLVSGAFPGRPEIPLTAGTSLAPTSILVESPLPDPSILPSYNTDRRGHQFKPIIAHVRDKIVVGWGDSRNTGTRLEYTPEEAAAGTGHRVALTVPSDAANRFNNFISDFYGPNNQSQLKFRQTIEMRLAYAEPYKNGTFGSFTSSVRGSKFLYGSNSKGTPGTPIKIMDMEANPATSLTASGGTKPFIGDFFDFGYQRIVMTPTGPRFNNSSDNMSGIFSFADNRRVRGPAVGADNWSQFVPVGAPGCVIPHARNQEVYEFNFNFGLIAEFFFNSKPLNATFPREFALLVQNTTSIPRTFLLTIMNQPVGGQASFTQKILLGTATVAVPARSTLSRPVYVTSSDSRASVTVKVEEIGGSGLQASAVINPDGTNPPTLDPDNAPPGSSINSAESYNPNVGYSQVRNPTPDLFTSTSGITNPAATDPDLTDPDLTEPFQTDPDLTDPDLTDPDLTDPDLTDPDLTDPDLTLADFSSGTLSDTTWPVSSEGNTSSTQATKLFLTDRVVACTPGCQGSACTPDCRKLQLILRRVTRSLTARGCELRANAQNVVVASVPSTALATQATDPDLTDPDLTDPDLTDPDLTDPDLTDPDLTNATLTLPPSETNFDPTKISPGSVRMTLRSVTPNPSTGSTLALTADEGPTPVNFTAPLPKGLATAVKAVLASHAVNTPDLPNPSAKVPKTLFIASTNVSSTPNFPDADFPAPPPGVLCVPYAGHTLKAVGGVSPYTWCLAQPQLPGTPVVFCPASPNPASLSNGLLLSTGPEADPRTSGGGVITSGGSDVQTCFTNPAPGLSGIHGLKSYNLQVQDSAPSPPFLQKHINTEQLNIQINKVEVTLVTACKQGTGPGPGCVTELKNDDLVTVRVTVLNNTGGTLAANNPSANVNNVSTTLTVVPTGTAGDGCGPASPLSANIAGNATQVFTYTCGPVSPAGTLTFRASPQVTVPAGVFVTDASKDSNPVTVVNPK